MNNPANCPNCAHPAGEGNRFCTDCGATLKSTTATRRGPKEKPAMKSKHFYCTDEEFPGLVDRAEKWLQHDYSVQRLLTEEGETVLQIARDGEWRKFVGMNTALNIFFGHKGDILNVKIGAGSWIDKAAAGMAGYFLFTPLAVPVAIGTWEQWRLPEQIFTFIENQLGMPEDV